MITEAVNNARIRENEVANFGEWINSVRDGGRISFADYTNAGRETGEAGRTSNVDDRERNRETSGDNRTSNRDSYKQGKSSRVKEYVFETDEDNAKGKASRELDLDYMSAVNRGDMETAQKVVDEAAKHMILVLTTSCVG